MQPLTIKTTLQLSPHLPRLDREVLLSYVLGTDRGFLLARDEVTLTPAQARRYRTLLIRAEKHEPIAYIIGEKEFYGRTFFVGPGALIPRPETETLVEHVIEHTAQNIQHKALEPKRKIAVIDVGTGSGAIIISLVKEFSSRFHVPHSTFSFFAVDSEVKALCYARKNAKRHRVETVIQFKRSDLLTEVKKKLAGYAEVFIIANLPYLSTKLYRSTAANVKLYEPKSALISGTDGLAHYRHLMRELFGLRRQGVNIHFFFEISPEQATLCKKWLSPKTLPETLQITPDLAGKARVVSGTLR